MKRRSLFAEASVTISCYCNLKLVPSEMKCSAAWPALLCWLACARADKPPPQKKSPRVDVRAVLVNCESEDGQWGSPMLSTFEREELYRHSTLRDCNKKITLTLRLQADPEEEGSDEYIWVESAFDGQSGENVPLLNPYVVKLRQQPVLQAYNLSYVTTLKDERQQASAESGRPVRVNKKVKIPRRKKRGLLSTYDNVVLTHDAAGRNSFSVRLGQASEHAPHPSRKQEAAANTPMPTEAESDSESESESEQDSEMESESDQDSEGDSESESDSEVESQTEQDTDSESQTEFQSASESDDEYESQTDSLRAYRSRQGHNTSGFVSRAGGADRKRTRGRNHHKTHAKEGISRRVHRPHPVAALPRELSRRKRFLKREVNNGSEPLAEPADLELAEDYEEAEPRREQPEADEAEAEEEDPYEPSRRYKVYVIGEPALWYSAGLQLFERQAAPDGEAMWSDVTGGLPVRIGSLDPEQFAGDPEGSPDGIEGACVSLRYSPGDCLRSEHTVIPAPDKLLLLVPKPINVQEKYMNGAGEFLIAPLSVISDNKLKRQDGWSEPATQKERARRKKMTERVFHAARPLRTVCSRRAADGGDARADEDASVTHALVRRHGVNYLAVRHPGAHRVQLDIEARADYNQLITMQTSARICSVAADGTRPRRSVITAHVSNTGLMAAQFRIVIGDCPAGMDELVASATLPPAVVVPPRHTRRLHLDLAGPLPLDTASCSLSVLNDKGETSAIRTFTLGRNDRCFCVWHCACACIEKSPSLRCELLRPEELVAAGLSTQDAPRRARAVCYSDSAALDVLLLLVGLMIILLALGITKGIIGLAFPRVGVWGLERLVEIPRELDEYYEPWLKHRAVLYDCSGWAVHPDSKKRSVRLMSLTMEMCLNTVFFLTFPCAILWTMVWLISSKVCPCFADRCLPPYAPCYAWSQSPQTVGMLSVEPRTVTTGIALTGGQGGPLVGGGGGGPGSPRMCGYGSDCSGDDTAEESDTNYVLMQMQKSKESIVRTQQKRGEQTSPRNLGD